MATADAENTWLPVFLSTSGDPLFGPLFSEALRIQRGIGCPGTTRSFVGAAIHADCDILYSEDFQDGQPGSGRLV